MEDMQQLVRAEMANVLHEVAQAGNHRAILGASPFDPFATDPSGDRMQLLKERVATLEDALAKSEADRAATYMKLDQLNRSLAAANEEKLALMHEYHDANHGPVAEATMLLTAAQEDTHKLRHQLSLLSERYDNEVPQLRTIIREQELEMKRLRKLAKNAKEERYDAVTLADLHYSNERLSAQLAKIQAPPPQPIFDEAKFKELEQAVFSLTSEMTNLEAKMARMKLNHEAEKRDLQHQLEVQAKEFAAERAECDRVVGIMTVKLESLIEENNLLRGVANGGRRTPTKRFL